MRANHSEARAQTLSHVATLLVGTLVLATVVAAMNSTAGAVGFGLFAAVAFLVSMAFWLALGVAFELAQRIVVLEEGQHAEEGHQRTLNPSYAPGLTATSSNHETSFAI
jgi:hypothetical protein